VKRLKKQVVVELISQKLKSHTIVESLIMLACKIIVITVIGKETESGIGKVPLSENTISRRVDDLSHDVEDVLPEILKIITLL
jgi:hypothetical protein